MAAGKGIFGATAENSVLYKGGQATATLDGAGDMVLTDLTLQITRQLSPIYTLGKGVRWSATLPSGTLEARGIYTSSDKVVSTLGTDECKKHTIEVMLTEAMCSEGGSGSGNSSNKLTIEDGYCSNITFQMSGQQGFIGENFTVNFTTLTAG